MTRWRIPLGVMAIVLMTILAIFLQDVVRQVIIVPAAYLLFLLKFYYSAIPQVYIWILILVIIVLLMSIFISRGFNIDRKRFLVHKKTSSPMEILADWIKRSKGGNYFKWRVANRLGRISREMNDSGSVSRRDSPADVRRYLEAGLQESFVDYPFRSLLRKKNQVNPFNSDVNKVVSYLESLMEEHHEK